MPDFTKVKRLLTTKDKTILSQQAKLEAALIELGNQFANDLERIVGLGAFDRAAIISALQELGWENELLDSLQSFFDDILPLSQEISQAMGINFILTAQQEADLTALLEARTQKILTNFRDEIAQDLFSFATESKLSQRPSKQIVSEAEARLGIVGRRAATEVTTAISIFDRATMNAVYENAEIRKFVYFPPTLVPKSRDSCRRAIADPRQRTGWTREDIQNEPDLDFVLGGAPYFNCRHEWIPFGTI